MMLICICVGYMVSPMYGSDFRLVGLCVFDSHVGSFRCSVRLCIGATDGTVRVLRRFRWGCIGVASGGCRGCF